MSKHFNTNHFNTSLVFWYSARGLIVTVLLSGLLQISCASLVEPIQALGYTWRAYERTIRWGDVSGSSTFLREQAAAKVSYSDNIEQLKVTGYNVLTKSINEDTMIAHQVVNIRYYFEDNPVEKSFTDKQEWHYDENKTRWYLVTAPPKFLSK